MYLKDGREILECDRYPGYYIVYQTGDFCDEHGNLVGGNIDRGDSPGCTGATAGERVWVSKFGKQYYPHRTTSANISMPLIVAKSKGLKPSKGYISYMERQRNNPTKRRKR